MNNLGETEKLFHEAQQNEKEIENLRISKSQNYEANKSLIIGLNNYISTGISSFSNKSESEIENLKLLTNKLEVLVKKKVAQRKTTIAAASETPNTKPEKVIDCFQNINFTTSKNNNNHGDTTYNEVKENFTKQWLEYNKALQNNNSKRQSETPELEIIGESSKKRIISYPEKHPNHPRRRPRTPSPEQQPPPLPPPPPKQQYSPKNKNQKYKEEMTFSFLAPASQGKYIRDCTKKVYQEQTENKFKIKQFDDETLLIFTATRPGQINAVLQHTMQDFELTSKRSQKPSKKLAYLIDKSETTRKICMDLESVEVTVLLPETAIEFIFTSHKLFKIPKQDQVLLTTLKNSIIKLDSNESILTVVGQKVHVSKCLQWIFKRLFDPDRERNLVFRRRRKFFDGKNGSSGIFKDVEQINYTVNTHVEVFSDSDDAD